MPAAQIPGNGPVGIPGVDDMTLGEVQGSVVQGSGLKPFFRTPGFRIFKPLNPEPLNPEPYET
jgi:hypothetical protein